MVAEKKAIIAWFGCCWILSSSSLLLPRGGSRISRGGEGSKKEEGLQHTLLV